MSCLLDTVNFGQKNKKENQKEPHGLQEIKKNYVQDSGSIEAWEKQKENQNENKRTEISRNADKIQWDKKKNQRTLISASGCKGWLWLWLWLSFAVPVFSKDALLRGGGQLRGRQQDIFDMSYQPGPPRAPLGRWDWKAPWADETLEQQRRQRQSTAARSWLNCTVVTQEAWFANFDVEWPLGNEPLLNLGWLVFLGIFGGCWSCLFNLSIPPPLGEKGKVFRRKQKPKLWKMKRQIKAWEHATKKLVTVIYSCRIVKNRRLKRSERQRHVLQKFVWWFPQKYRHCGSSVKIILGKQSQNWPKWSSPDSGSEIKNCETNLLAQTACMNRTELSGGAGAKAASRRKRQQNQENQGLADAVTEFLHSWTKPDQRRQQTKGTSKSGDMSLARKLIAVLKTCLNEGSSDSEVAETLLKHLPQTNKPEPQRIVTWADAWDDQEPWQEAESWSRPAKRHRHDSGDYQQQFHSKEPNNKKGKGHGLSETRSNEQIRPRSWAQSVAEEPHPKRGRNTEEAGERDAHAQTYTHRFASHINPQEWAGNVKLCKLADLEKALSLGDPLPGNLVISPDPKVVKEAHILWSAHERSEPLTIGISTKEPGEKHQTPVSIWWKPGKQMDSRPVRSFLNLTHISSEKGPTVAAPIKITIPNKKGPELVTLRLLVPDFYRQFACGTHHTDDPGTVISSWAKHVACPVASLTGGRWEKVSHRHGKFLIAHIRTSKKIADKICESSGHQALFATTLPCKLAPTRSTVTWIPRSENMTAEVYWNYVKKQSELKKCPMAIRQGGNSDLGLIGANPQDFPDERAKHWFMKGVPHHWDSEQVTSFLTTQMWSNIEIRNRRKFKGMTEWTFKGRQPPRKDGGLSFFHYADDEDDTLISIFQDLVKTKLAMEKQWLYGPKKSWFNSPDQVSNDASQVPPTVMDSSQEQVENTANSENDSEKRERSPRRNNANAGSKPQVPKTEDDILLGDLPGWSLKDAGGFGDCGYRSIAVSISQLQNKELSKDGIIREASNLRVLTVKRLEKHPKYKDKWAPDVNEQANEEIGLMGPVESFQKYLTWVANKRYYIDGLQLKAIAEKLQQNIIVFKFRRQENLWQRFLISGKATDKAPECTSPPICLALKDKHYRALCRPDANTEVPQSWYMNTEEVDRNVFRGQGPKSVSKKSDTQSCSLSLPKSSSSGKSLQLSTKLSLPSPDKSVVGSESVRLSFAPTSEPARSSSGGDNLDLPSPDRSSCNNLDFSPAVSKSKKKKQVFLPQAPQKSGTFPFRIRGKQTIDKKRILQIKRVLNIRQSSPECRSSCPPVRPCRKQSPGIEPVQSLGSVDIPKRKRFRAAKHETFRKTRRIQEVIQLQQSKQNRVNVPAQQGLGGLPVFPSSDLDVPWWTCALCGFRVFRHGTDRQNNPAYRERRKHLKNVHGTTATSLPKWPPRKSSQNQES